MYVSHVFLYMKYQIKKAIKLTLILLYIILYPQLFMIEGITQDLVDNGIPIGTCLHLFNKWIKNLMDEYQLILDKDQGNFLDKGLYGLYFFILQHFIH